MDKDRKYRPSNGTEGEGFIGCYCMNCIHEKFIHTQVHGDRQCDILDRTMVYDLNDPEYPEEWIYKDGEPTCTKYQHWDWWGGPWGNDFNQPPPEPIDDPNQLCINFVFDEIVQELELA